MKTERELFLKINNLSRLENMIEYSEDRNIFVFKVVNCNLDLGVALHKLNYGWEMWCASAQREGYKLVPVEINDDIESAMFSSVVKGGLPCDIYKAMIGASE